MSAHRSGLSGGGKAPLPALPPFSTFEEIEEKERSERPHQGLLRLDQATSLLEDGEMDMEDVKELLMDSAEEYHMVSRDLAEGQSDKVAIMKGVPQAARIYVLADRVLPEALALIRWFCSAHTGSLTALATEIHAQCEALESREMSPDTADRSLRLLRVLIAGFNAFLHNVKKTKLYSADCHIKQLEQAVGFAREAINRLSRECSGPTVGKAAARLRGLTAMACFTRLNNKETAALKQQVDGPYGAGSACYGGLRKMGQRDVDKLLKCMASKGNHGGAIMYLQMTHNCLEAVGVLRCVAIGVSEVYPQITSAFADAVKCMDAQSVGKWGGRPGLQDETVRHTIIACAAHLADRVGRNPNSSRQSAFHKLWQALCDCSVMQTGHYVLDHRPLPGTAAERARMESKRADDAPAAAATVAVSGAMMAAATTTTPFLVHTLSEGQRQMETSETPWPIGSSSTHDESTEGMEGHSRDGVRSAVVTDVSKGSGLVDSIGGTSEEIFRSRSSLPKIVDSGREENKGASLTATGAFKPPSPSSRTRIDADSTINDLSNEGRGRVVGEADALLRGVSGAGYKRLRSSHQLTSTATTEKGDSRSSSSSKSNSNMSADKGSSPVPSPGFSTQAPGVGSSVSSNAKNSTDGARQGPIWNTPSPPAGLESSLGIHSSQLPLSTPPPSRRSAETTSLADISSASRSSSERKMGAVAAAAAANSLPSSSSPSFSSSSSSPAVASAASPYPQLKSAPEDGPLWKQGQPYQVVLGDSFLQSNTSTGGSIGGGNSASGEAGRSARQIVHLKYDFVPGRTNLDAPATLRQGPLRGADGKTVNSPGGQSHQRWTADMEYESRDVDNPRPVRFSGDASRAQELECVLVFDGTKFIMDRVSVVGGLKYVQDATAAAPAVNNRTAGLDPAKILTAKKKENKAKKEKELQMKAKLEKRKERELMKEAQKGPTEKKRKKDKRENPDEEKLKKTGKVGETEGAEGGVDANGGGANGATNRGVTLNCDEEEQAKTGDNLPRPGATSGGGDDGGGAVAAATPASLGRGSSVVVAQLNRLSQPIGKTWRSGEDHGGSDSAISHRHHNNNENVSGSSNSSNNGSRGDGVVREPSRSQKPSSSDGLPSP